MFYSCHSLHLLLNQNDSVAGSGHGYRTVIYKLLDLLITETYATGLKENIPDSRFLHHHLLLRHYYQSSNVHFLWTLRVKARTLVYILTMHFFCSWIYMLSSSTPVLTLSLM